MKWQTVKDIALVIGAIWFILSTVHDCQRKATAPYLGDQGGPHHHEVMVGTPENDDLSCEEDH